MPRTATGSSVSSTSVDLNSDSQLLMKIDHRVGVCGTSTFFLNLLERVASISFDMVIKLLKKLNHFAIPPVSSQASTKTYKYVRFLSYLTKEVQKQTMRRGRVEEVEERVG